MNTRICFNCPKQGVRQLYTYPEKTTLEELLEDPSVQRFMLELGPPALVYNCPKCKSFFGFKAFNMYYPPEGALCWTCSWDKI